MDRLVVVARLTALTLRDAPWLTPGQAAVVATAVVDKVAPGSVGRPSPTPDDFADIDMGDSDGLNELDPAPGSADEREPEVQSMAPGRGEPANSFHLGRVPLRRQGDAIQLGEPWTFAGDGKIMRTRKGPSGPHIQGPDGPGEPEGPEDPTTASSWSRLQTEAEANWLKNKAREPQFSATAFFRSVRR